MMKGDQLTVVMYHYVRDLKHSRYPAIKGLDVSLFKGQVSFLKKALQFCNCRGGNSSEQRRRKIACSRCIAYF